MIEANQDQALRRAALHGVVVRNRLFSTRVAGRVVVVSAILVAVLAVGAVVSLVVGDFSVPVRDVLDALTGRASGGADFIVNQIRLPRVLTAMLVGASFGMSGAIFQSLVRNPLASPDIIGFNSGAALGAVIVIVVLGSDEPTFSSAPVLGPAVSVGAVIGGLITGLVVIGLSWQRGLHASRLVLIGLGIAFATTAGVDLLISRAQINEVSSATLWLTGSLNARSWADVRIVAFGLAVLAPIAIALEARLNRLALGDETATGLGIRVSPTKAALAVVGVLLSALAVVAAGPIAFVAFVAGPIARRITNTPNAALVQAALVGAIVCLFADLLGRRLFAPTILPVGVMTAVIGAPYLLWLLSRQLRTGSM